MPAGNLRLDDNTTIEQIALSDENVRLANLYIMGMLPLGPDHVEKMVTGARDMAHLRRWLMRQQEFRQRYLEIIRFNAERPPPPEGDGALLRLVDYRSEGNFMATYDRHFAPLLGARAETFRAIFGALLERRSSDVRIVETGTLRNPGSWDDGQSTFMFDQLVAACGGLFWSVDISVDAAAAARQVCSPRTQLVVNDSIAFLRTLHKTAPDLRLDLLYLDSYDIDFDNPGPSARHHLHELEAALPMLAPGSLVCLDDTFATADGVTGKGSLVDGRMRELGAEQLFSDYQTAWVMP